jgi:hypothetical protein
LSWLDTELVLATLVALASPTTLLWSVLVLVLSDRPLRTGLWFFAGAFGATLAVGVAADLVFGNAAASHHSSTPKTWVAVLDIFGGLLLAGFLVRTRVSVLNQERVKGMVAKMTKVASSPAIAILGAGAALATPGALMPFALKAVSQEDLNLDHRAIAWVFYSFVALLPLAVAILLLFVARDWAEALLLGVRNWLVLHARAVAAVLIAALALVLIRNGISGLRS